MNASLLELDKFMHGVETSLIDGSNISKEHFARSCLDTKQFINFIIR